MRVLHLLYPCPQLEKSKKGKEKSKKQKEKQKEKEQTKKKKKEGKEKKTRGQTPKKKEEEAAEEGDEDEEEEDEEDDEIILLGKKQARVASAKAQVARMKAAGTRMGRQVRSTLLERIDPMSPDSGKGRSRSGSGGESSSSGSSSTSTSVGSSSNNGDTEQDEPSKLAKTKTALRNVESEEVVARAKKPHFYVETSGRPPRVLPTRATRQEKHKSSDAHQRSLQFLEEFPQEYDGNAASKGVYSVGRTGQQTTLTTGTTVLAAMISLTRNGSGRTCRTRPTRASSPGTSSETACRTRPASVRTRDQPRDSVEGEETEGGQLTVGSGQWAAHTSGVLVPSAVCIVGRVAAAL